VKGTAGSLNCWWPEIESYGQASCIPEYSVAFRDWFLARNDQSWHLTETKSSRSNRMEQNHEHQINNAGFGHDSINERKRGSGYYPVFAITGAQLGFHL
jgi:hypothetical protein